MPSPFPGMNPYLERAEIWRDFHETLVPAIREHLVPQVRPRFQVRVEEHLYIHELDAESRRLIGSADVSVGHEPQSPAVDPATVVMAAPASVVLPAVVMERESFLEIRDQDSGDIVTVMEVLSPTNKRSGPDREQYLAKRNQVLASTASLIEIDLLRSWPRMPMAESPKCSYCVLVSRPRERPKAGMWPIGLRDHLPLIPVPLAPGVPEAGLELQHILHRVYDAAGYEDYVYKKPIVPPLSAEDASWAAEIVAKLTKV